MSAGVLPFSATGHRPPEIRWEAFARQTKLAASPARRSLAASAHCDSDRIKSDSVPVIHELSTVAVTSASTASVARHFPASVLLQEHDMRTSTHFGREEKITEETQDRRRMDKLVPISKEKKSSEFDHYLKDFQHQLLYWPGFWYLLPSTHPDDKSLSPSSNEYINKDVLIKPEPTECSGSNSVELWDALTLAQEAVTASKEAALLAENPSYLDQSCFFGSKTEDFTILTKVKDEAVVRSRRLLERQSKRRNILKKRKAGALEDYHPRVKEKRIQMNTKSFDPNDPFRLFLLSPETRQLLTAKEEQDLFVQIEDLMRLEEVKGRLQTQFDREPTMVEWAQAVGMSCRDLHACINSGNRSRDKMIYANFRLVVHVAKKYQGSGLSMQDLLQEGGMGLMKSVEKFKPLAGCRFSSYAFWWIRQTIRKAIFHHSRTIRLPENVYALLTQVKNARRSYIQEGHLPSNEDLAKSLGITVEKLERLLLTTRIPLSIQQPAWGADQDVTFQEITADPKVEIPDLVVGKQLMRRHVRNLLTTLAPRERQILQLRYGIHDGERRSLSQIGAVFGISKERVRQVEGNALNKLKQRLSSEGLEAYVNLLV